MDLSFLNKEQLEAVQTSEGPLMILAGAGSGKALLNTTKVLTKNGYLPIGKLKAGSRIYGSDGSLKKVLGVYPQGKKRIYEISFSDGTTIKCCEDHLWTVGKIDEDFRTLSTKKLSFKNITIDGVPQFFIPNIRPIEFSEHPLPLNPYLFGLLIITSVFTDKGLRFVIKDDLVREKIKEELSKEGFELKNVKEHLFDISGKNDEGKTVEDIFKELGLVSKDKFIPKIYKINAVHLRRFVLIGIIDAVGKNAGLSYEITLPFSLVADVKFIAETLSFIAKTTTKQVSFFKNNVVKKKTINKVIVYPNTKFVNNLHTLESKNVEVEDKKFNYKYITKIKKTNKSGEMTCIKIDSPDELFVIDHCTLTHNTTVIVNKVAKIIEEGTNPSRILMLTFTNKAADEMMQRIAKILGISSDEKLKVQGGTYHSFCAELLRRNADEIGFEPNFSICDAPDAAEIINLLKERIGFKKEDNLPGGKTILQLFSYCLNHNKEISYAIENKFTQCEGKEKELEKIREEYSVYKYNNNILDYDDLLLQTNLFLENNEELCRKISSFYKYILVDEYQDSNRMQMELLLHLRKFDNKNICVVGDPEQCIYTFRGSRYENILEFANQFEGCKIVKLNKNYRSNQEILDLSNNILQGTGVFENKLVSDFHAPYRPTIVATSSLQDEADFIIRKINQFVKQGVKLSDIAVLSRTSNDSSTLESRLSGIEYNKFGGIRFWERESTKNVLSYLKVLNNINDEISWFRILKLYPSIGSVNAKRITENLTKEGIEELLSDTYAKKQYFEFLGEIYKEYNHIQKLDLTEKINYLVNKYYPEVMKRNISVRKIKETDKRRELRSLEEDVERLQNLIALSDGYRSLNSYINDLLLDTSQSNYKQDALTISTVHSAKGLEWKIVFILSCIEGKFPSDKGVSANTTEAFEEHEEELREEKRCFYVAITRCKDELFLMYPKYNLFTRTENDLTRYLVEDENYKNLCDFINYM